MSSVSLIDRVSACDTVMLIPFRFTPQRWQQAVNPNTGIKISFLKLACAVVDQHLKCVFVRILHDTDEYALAENFFCEATCDYSVHAIF